MNEHLLLLFNSINLEFLVYYFIKSNDSAHINII